MKSVLKEKRELYKKWNKLKRLGENEDLSFDQFFKIRKEEEKYYFKWKFYDGISKAKEKVENEKKKNKMV